MNSNKQHQSNQSMDESMHSRMGSDASEESEMKLSHQIVDSHVLWVRPSRRTSIDRNRSSYSSISISSIDSGGGGKIKHSRGQLSGNKKKQSTASLMESQKSPYSSSNRLSLRPSFKSVPMIRTLRVSSSRSIRGSIRNEDWDYTPVTKKSSSKMSSLYSSSPRPKSSMKSTSLKLAKKNTKKKRHGVAFVERPGMMHYDNGNPSTSLWYQKPDHSQFIDNTVKRAQITERTMKYASINERSYNSSTGLTSPQVLKEYLSSPEEIIGTEHLLAGQGFARSSLRCHHVRVLVEEQRRQEEEGSADPDFLAERLHNTSGISTHLAQERAAYINLLD